jgi:hypothetical protein
MPQEKSSFSRIQKTLLITAFEAIVALLKEKGVQATVSSTDDSRKVSFVGKNGKECEFGCWISAAERFRIYQHFVRPAREHENAGTDMSGAFASDINPETIVRAFKSHFRYHI